MKGDFNLKKWQQNRVAGKSVGSRAGQMLALAAKANKEKDKELLQREC
jgi:hypothetical protein